MDEIPQRIRIATRESRLAMRQTEMVAAALVGRHPALAVEIVGMTTRGDRVLDRPLAQVGGKGLFVKELEVALDEGRADIAVHSLKDVPMQLPGQFALRTFGAREDPRDAFVSNRYAAPGELPRGAVVGTSSLRRESQLRRAFPGLDLRPLRGNVNTRLAKLDAGDYDAIILAMAGLSRLGLGSVRDARWTARSHCRRSARACSRSNTGAIATTSRACWRTSRTGPRPTPPVPSAPSAWWWRAAARFPWARSPPSPAPSSRSRASSGFPMEPASCAAPSPAAPRKPRRSAARWEKSSSPPGGARSFGPRGQSRMSARRLQGVGVVITRPRAAGETLAAALMREGARAFVFPALAIEDMTPAPRSAAAIDGLDRCGLAIFVSANAVEKGLAAALRRGPWPARTRVAAIGEATAQSLRNSGFASVISPRERHDSEALLALPELRAVKGRASSFSGARAEGSTLREALEARGARVEYVECYRRVRPDVDPTGLLRAWGKAKSTR